MKRMAHSTAAPDGRSNRRVKGFLIGGLVVGIGISALSAPAAVATTGLGAITVSVLLDGATAPLSGWEMSLSSSNCPVPPTTAMTDSGGQATFSGLAVYADSAETTVCTYDVSQMPKAGFQQITAPDDLTGLTAGTPQVAANSGVSLTSVSGTFTNVTRNPEPNGSMLAIDCLSGVGTSEIRSGRHPIFQNCSLAPANQTGLRFTGIPTPSGSHLPVGESVVANLTHFNQTIQRGAHNYDLQTSFVLIDDLGAAQTISAVYAVQADETTDSLADPAACEYQGPSVPNSPFACADRLTLVQPNDTRVVLGTAIVDLRLAFGVLANGSCGAATNEAFTAERTDTVFCLLATVDAIDPVEPTVVSIVNRADATAGPVDPVVPVQPVSSATPSEQDGAATLAESGSEPRWLMGAGLLSLVVGGLLIVARRFRRAGL